MYIFDYKKYKEFTWDNEIISYISQLHEYRGKQDLYARQKPIALERLIEIAKIQSTESSNVIEGIVTTKPRLKKIMHDKITPKNRDEEEILGYKNALELIHENYEAIPINSSYILQLHGELLKYAPYSHGGKFKTIPNEIVKTHKDGSKETLFVPLEPYETQEAVEMLCNEFNKALEEEIVDPLILIPIFILDFLCIHPFKDGNGRMSRLMTLLLLYKSGYKVGQYISIEKSIADTKESYYFALAASDKGWHDYDNDPRPFIKYMLGVILACYREFESRIMVAENVGAKSTSYDVVREYALNVIGTFTKQEALEHCPSLGSSSVEAALKKLVEEGTLKRIGSGRKTCYVKADAHSSNGKI